MLNKDEAERLAAEVLANERGPRRTAPPRRAWFMGLWRMLCPGLDSLGRGAARALVGAAQDEAGRGTLLRSSSMLPLMAGPLLANRFGLQAAWLVLPAILAWLVAYAWLVRRCIERRLPEALAAGIEMGEV